MSETLRKSGKPVRLALIGVATMLLGGCADTGRGGDPFADPFKSAGLDRSPTGSTVAAPPQQQASNFFTDAFKPFDAPAAPPPAPAVHAAPRAPRPPVAIDSQPLAAPSAAAAPAAFRPSYAAAPASSSAVHAAPGGVGGWSAEGGTPIVVAQGENVEMIAQRYGVPTASLLSANGYANRAQVQPGARLIIPVYHANGARVAAAPVAAPMPHLATPKAPAPAKLAKVEPPKPDLAAEKRARLAEAKAAEASRKTAEAQAAKAKATAPMLKAATLKLEAAKAREAKASAEAAKLAQAKTAQLKPVQVKPDQVKPDQAKPDQAKLAQKPAQPGKKVASAAPAPAPVTPAPAVAPVQPATSKFEKAPAVDHSTTATLPPAGGAASDDANPEFRWPARGRVIQAFGAGGNDGINIAVPEGTQVKASEGGVVAYAGSELKGYGNLVLIRHPNGFVSAYANNGSLNVKRGDTVKRGQTIALSGQSGNVASPQLHFELRKGSKPVDPSTYLAGL
ncbi:peptidoglycan DD-metalloendopeptidase family protein [Rhodoblastus sp.]|uniref:peptidoglycan DD-metalloendopeptidase family protein n=1 Tax=Rhodoblastus sp. TaxID=1962975 RepID=UPI003F9C03C5